MGFQFSDKDIENISEILGAKPEYIENAWAWRLLNKETKQSLVFTLYNNVMLGKEYKGPLVSVQTHHGYYELHDCTGFLVFEPDEIIFVQAKDDSVSSLIIGKQCSCSMYTNIRREILNADFSTLDPAVLLSAMQLSLTETVLP